MVTGGQHAAQQQDPAVNSKFDLIIGSDILYERDEQGDLANYINEHMEDHAEVWVVDPNRGNRAHFSSSTWQHKASSSAKKHSIFLHRKPRPPTKAECSPTHEIEVSPQSDQL